MLFESWVACMLAHTHPLTQLRKGLKAVPLCPPTTIHRAQCNSFRATKANIPLIKNLKCQSLLRVQLSWILATLSLPPSETATTTQYTHPHQLYPCSFVSTTLRGSANGRSHLNCTRIKWIPGTCHSSSSRNRRRRHGGSMSTARYSSGQLIAECVGAIKMFAKSKQQQQQQHLQSGKWFHYPSTKYSHSIPVVGWLVLVAFESSFFIWTRFNSLEGFRGRSKDSAAFFFCCGGDVHPEFVSWG